MRQEQLLLLVSAAAVTLAAADTPPRGVGPEFVSFYKPSTGTFQCISNPSVQLDYDQVNDDFCDCPDGSDEPGTSACAHLSSLSPQDPSTHFSSKPALPGFYCENTGHKPSYIPFTHVNDGICDYELCCDGSEEYDQAGKHTCPDKCKEIGAEWKKQDEARQKSLDAAIQKRQDLMKQAQIKRREMKAEIDSLRNSIQTNEIKVRKLTKELADIEADEEKKKASAPASKIQILINAVKPKIKENLAALKKLQSQRDFYSGRVSQLEAMLDDLHKSYNPNFNDEGVKRVVKSFQDFKASANDEKEDDEEDSEPQAEFDSKLYLLHLEGEDVIPWDDYTKPDSDTSAIYDLQKYLPESLRDWISEKLFEVRQLLADNGIIAKKSTDYSTANESKPVRDARTRLDVAKDELEKAKKKKTENEDDLTKDYGISDVFRPLKGSCVELDAGEYTYEMCWLQKVRQKSKKGGGQQDMGSFVKYQTIRVDEELPADGKGVGSGERLALKFEDGTHCWNGPDRSTTVVLACAENEEIWKVTEEEKCVYRMLVGSPAVCDDPTQGKDNAARVRGGKAPGPGGDHDEL